MGFGCIKAVKAEEVSFEIGASFQPVPNGLKLTAAEEQVYAFLAAYKQDIVAAEKRFRVTRVAIAGAIAWEMLENACSGGVRAVGAGKVHLNNDRARAMLDLEDNNTAAAQVEDRGYLPKRSYSERKVQLAIPSGAIGYIGAIMAGIADLCAKHGFGDIRDDAIILTNVYQSKDLKSWEEHLIKKPKGSTLSGGNTMDIWVKKNMSFLTSAVGTSEIPPVSLAPTVDAVERLLGTGSNKATSADGGTSTPAY